MDETAKIFVRPAQIGRRIHFPGREDGLAAEGEWVPREDYWLVRLGHGAVVACEPSASAVPTPEPEGGGAMDEDAPPESPARTGKKRKRRLPEGGGAMDEDAQE